ncbi:hypothetical protein WCP94_002240 [Bilophila wadsworthia]
MFRLRHRCRQEAFFMDSLEGGGLPWKGDVGGSQGNVNIY